MSNEEKQWAEDVYAHLKDFDVINCHSSVMIDLCIFHEMGCDAKETASALAGRNPALRKKASEEARRRDGPG